MSQFPLIVAPMFLVSTPEMVIESSKSGAIGSFPLLNARPIETCASWLEEIKEALPTEAWAVNLICHPVYNKRYEDDVRMIKTYEPPIVITSLGDPTDVCDIVHAYGGKVYSDVAYVNHAKKAASAGVDGLILVTAGAGGHGGTLNPFAFIQAVKSFFDGTIILSGAMSKGSDIAAARLMGADYAYMGTRFIAVEESNAQKEYKEMIVESTIDDILYTDVFSGVLANFLIPSIQAAGLDPANLSPETVKKLSDMSETTAWRDIWSAGQGVAGVHEITTTKQAIETLKEEYQEALAQLK